MFKERQFVFTTAWKISKLYEKAMKEIHKEYKLTQCEMDVLLFLKINKPMNTSRDIAEYRSISKSLICKSVSLLCEKDLIFSIGDENDARVMRLELTENGEQIANQLLESCDKMCEEMFATVSNSEIQMLSNLFPRMINNGTKPHNLF